MWPVLQQRWWHGKLQRNPKVLATGYITSNWPDFLCTNRHQLFSFRYNFFAKLIIYIFSVCFQSILSVSKRLLIILLSHSKFFIGHCTYPLFLGTFSFAATSRIYHFFAKWTLKDCQQAMISYNFLYFSQYAEARCYPKKKMPRFWLQIQKI